MSGTIKAIYFSRKNNESDFPKYLNTIDESKKDLLWPGLIQILNW